MSEPASASLHILGVCGTFMAGIALLARELGVTVAGSDANPYPPMSTQLADAGIEVLSGYRAEHLQRSGVSEIVVGNAMTRGNPAVEYLLDQGLHYQSGPQWLAEQVLAGRWTLAVAGTHGKTTTSAMLAWILDYAGLQPGFLIGGLPANFGVSARLGGGSFFVVEADEYDSAFFDKRSKFVHYRPRTLVLNNLEFDHADIFSDLAAIQRQFHHLIRTVPGQGLIISNGAEAALEETLAQGCWTPVERFNGDDPVWRARLLKADGSQFQVYCGGRDCGQVSWSQLGRHNVDNALAALAAARHAGVPVAIGLQALSHFAGVKRRMEHRGTVAGVAVYDDFAHHPSAIAASVAALRASINGVGDSSGGRLLALLELRSNTMRRGVFNHQLANALAAADVRVVCADPALELTLDGCEVVASAEAALQMLLPQVQAGDRILVMSNGGFDAVHQRFLDALHERAAGPLSSS